MQVGSTSPTLQWSSRGERVAPAIARTVAITWLLISAAANSSEGALSNEWPAQDGCGAAGQATTAVNSLDQGIRTRVESRAILATRRVIPVLADGQRKTAPDSFVFLEATMDASGVPAIIRTVGGAPDLAPAAIAALNQWRFEPSSHSRATMVAFNMNAARDPGDPTDLAEPRSAGPCGGPAKIADFRPVVPKSVKARRVLQVEILHIVINRKGVVVHAYAVEPVSNVTLRALDAVMRFRFTQSTEPMSLMVSVPFVGTGEYDTRSSISFSTRPGPAEAVRLASSLAASSLSARYRRRTTRFVYGDSHRANALFMTVQDVAALPEHAEDFDRQDDVLMGRLDFDERGLLLSADFYGPLVSESQRIGMIRTLNEHPEWSPAEARNAFTAGKPKYGPDNKDAFVRLVRGLKLDRLLGQGSLSSVRFVLRDESGPLEAAARVVWTVRFRADAGRTYELEFEPYAGRLVRLARVEPE